VRRIDNGLGKATSIKYAGLGEMRAWARDQGIPWTRRSSVGQMVVAEIAVEDGLGWRSVTQVRYADAYFDGPTREFRGFGSAVQIEVGDSGQPSLWTDVRFDVGDTDEIRKGLPLETRRHTGAGHVFHTIRTSYVTRTLANAASGIAVRFAFASSQETRIFEGAPAPRILRKEWERDQYGNVTRETDYGEVSASGDGHYGDDETVTEWSYAHDEARWLLRHVAVKRVVAGDGRRVSESRTYYVAPPSSACPSAGSSVVLRLAPKSGSRVSDTPSREHPATTSLATLSRSETDETDARTWSTTRRVTRSRHASPCGHPRTERSYGPRDTIAGSALL
jgi:hypothetical protein